MNFPSGFIFLHITKFFVISGFYLSFLPVSFACLFACLFA